VIGQPEEPRKSLEVAGQILYDHRRAKPSRSIGSALRDFVEKNRMTETEFEIRHWWATSSSVADLTV
jgi:hypothetical protein